MIEFNVNKNTITTNGKSEGYGYISGWSNICDYDTSSIICDCDTDKCCSTASVATIATTNKNEPEKTFKTKSIIDLWHKRTISSINKKYEDKIDNLFANDKRVNVLCDYIQKIKDLFDDSDDVRVTITEADLIGQGKQCYLSKESQKEYDKLITDWKTEEVKHEELLLEIKALLLGCDGLYVEELNILKAYEIVDKNGKFNEIKNSKKK